MPATQTQLPASHLLLPVCLQLCSCCPRCLILCCLLRLVSSNISCRCSEVSSLGCSCRLPRALVLLYLRIELLLLLLLHLLPQRLAYCYLQSIAQQASKRASMYILWQCNASLLCCAAGQPCASGIQLKGCSYSYIHQWPHCILAQPLCALPRPKLL